MSAWIVSKAHIDYLVSAGLHWLPTRMESMLWWLDADPTPEDETHREGEPWGSGLSRFMDEHRHYLNSGTAGRVGAMLWAENRRSVNHRYAESEIEEPYLFREVETNALVTVKAIECYEYQSCEHPEWQTSEARRFCDNLKARMVYRILSDQPGYADAPWGIDEEYVKPRGISLMDIIEKRSRPA